MHPVTEADLPASGIELVDGGAGRRLREVGDGGPDRISDLEGKGLGGVDSRVTELKMLVGRPVAAGRGPPVVPPLADALAREPGGTAEGVLPGPLVQTSVTHPVGLAGQVDLVSDLPVARPVWLRVPVGGAHLRPGEAAVWIRPERRVHVLDPIGRLTSGPGAEVGEHHGLQSALVDELTELVRTELVRQRLPRPSVHVEGALSGRADGPRPVIRVGDRSAWEAHRGEPGGGKAMAEPLRHARNRRVPHTETVERVAMVDAEQTRMDQPLSALIGTDGDRRAVGMVSVSGVLPMVGGFGRGSAEEDEHGHERSYDRDGRSAASIRPVCGLSLHAPTPWGTYPLAEREETSLRHNAGVGPTS